MVYQTFDPDEVNLIINHPDVYPYVSGGVPYPLDCTDLMDGFNIFMMTEGGGFCFINIGDGIYEGHYYFLPEYRGRYAINAAKECLEWLAERKCVLTGRTPLENRPARLFNKLIGMTRVGIENDTEIWQWP